MELTDAQETVLVITKKTPLILDGRVPADMDLIEAGHELRKVGLVKMGQDRGRGLVAIAITDAGRKALAAHTDPNSYHVR